jgi:hypothetical protein
MFTRLSSLVFLTCLAALPAFADMAHIQADRDTTLIEFSEITQEGCPIEAGDVCANGSGPYFFTGNTNHAGIRRGLVRFNVAARLPENAIIDAASLRLYQSSGNAEPSAVSLHRVLSDWGEGESSATGGQGAPAEPNDATWLHTFYDHLYWVQEGGHFVPHASATAMVRGNGSYTWENTVHLENNVRFWLHAPEHNFGWLVMGDEYTRGSVKRFASRNSGNSTQRPVLTVEYHLPGE